MLVLNNGAQITVTGADTFAFQTGGNGVNGVGGATQNFTDFATKSLGYTTIPGSGITSSNALVIVKQDGGTVAEGGNDNSNNHPPPSLLTAAEDFANTITGYGDILPVNDPIVQGMILGSNAKWNSSALTYSFNTSIPGEYHSNPSYINGWATLNNTEKTAVRDVFEKLSKIIPVSFTETSGTGDLRFNVVNTDGSAGFTIIPGGNTPFSSGIYGDVFLSAANRTAGDHYSYLPGDSGYLTVVHEIGHAMGLKHPFESPFIPNQGLFDNYDYTVMSYTSAKNMRLTFTADGYTASYISSPLNNPYNYALFDVAALQAQYGANNQTQAGNSIYKVSSHDYEYLTIWDAGGKDTIDASDATGDCYVDLNPGQHLSIDVWTLEEQKAAANAFLAQQGYHNSDWVNSIFNQYADQLYTGENNLAIGYGVVIEDVITGSGDDVVVDNAVDNYISTGAGNDRIFLGMGGFDIVDGGSGFDTVVLNDTFRSQVQQERLDDGSLLIVTDKFAAQLINIEAVTCEDGDLFFV